MDLPKEIAGRFTLDTKIQERQNCVVYSAQDKNLGGRHAAVKIFVDKPNGDERMIKSFADEVNALRSASHQGLVPIIQAGHDQGWLYIAMELIEGPTLRDILKNEGKPFEFSRALNIVEQVGAALTELHEQKLVHGHLDSRAILFKGEQVRVAGYCPATIDKLQRQMTSGGRLTVDPAYVAPEQIATPDTVDGRADIYSLSALLFEMLTAQKPFNAGNPLQMAMARLSQPAPSPAKIAPGISPLVDAAVTKGLAKDPAGRFASVDELVDALTGGKAPVKNPLAEAASGMSERMSTETIAVSMSTAQLRQMLVAHQEGAPTGTPEKSTPKVNGSLANGSGADHDVVGTSVGMQAQPALSASLVSIDGETRGQKWKIGKSQTIIGADSSCDIALSGKAIPPRYAIIVQRGNDYTIGALSPSGLTINGEKSEGAEELLLKRGDVVRIGPYSLRFVAPGEVFTLQDNIADRIIDRPQSKLPKIVIAIAALVMVACVGGVWMYQEALAKQKHAAKLKEVEKEKKREALISRLLQEGDEFFKSGRLVDPVDANAQARFRSVLEINPDHTYAKRRLEEIGEQLQNREDIERRKQAVSQRVEGLLADADRYFRAGDYAYPPGKNARESCQEVLKLDPDNTIAKTQITEIDRMINDQLGRVQTLLARAQVYADLGQYVEPPGQNAFDPLMKVLKVSPGNDVAKNAILDMAAYSIFEGDQAKVAAKVATMKKSYLTAQALGVDPGFIEPRLAGAQLMEKSRSSIIIYDRKDGDSKKATSGKDAEKAGFLDTQEVERRVAALKLRAQTNPVASSRVFINLDKK